MANTVIINDASKVTQLKEALSTNNNSAVVINGINLVIGDVVELPDIILNSNNDFDTIMSLESNAWVYFENGFAEFPSAVFSVLIDDSPIVSGTFAPVMGVPYNVKVELLSQSSTNLYVGKRQSAGGYGEFIYPKIIAKGREWINSGDFGKTDLPSSPTGLTAIFDGSPEWVRVGDDGTEAEVYPDQAAYKATWGVSPIDPQIVYDTTGLLPPTGDASWDGEDVTVIDVTAIGQAGIKNKLRLSLDLKL
jgi:hypothetical protein